jgi:drug/metabolite transporter (DMT)-like permease
MASTTSATSSNAPVIVTAITVPPRFTGLDLALIISMCFWGSNYVVAKYATDVMPPMVYNVLRFSVAILCTYAFVRVRHVDLRLPRREWWPVIRAAILAYGIYQPFFINGLQYTTAGNAALILTAGPIWVVLLNAMRGRDRITQSIVFGVLIALSGVLVVVLGRFAGKLDLGGTSLLGDAMELIASILWGLGTIATSYPLGRSVNTIENGGNGSNPMTISFWVLFAGVCTQLFYGWPSFIGLQASSLVTPTVLIALFVSAICAVTFGTMVGNVAIGRRGASRTVIYNYLQPFIAALLGALFLGEVFTPWLIVGGLLIGIGVWMVRRS